MRLPDPSGHRDVALGLARDDGRVLLVLNARSAQGMAERFWDLPGGTVEPGEAVDVAVRRELIEEIGVEPAVGPLLRVVEGTKRTAKDAPPLYTWRAFVFAVDVGGASLRPGEGIDAVEWLDEQEAIARMTAPYQAPVVAWLHGERGTYERVDWIEPAVRDDASPIDAALRRLLVIGAAAAVGEVALVASEARVALGEGLD